MNNIALKIGVASDPQTTLAALNSIEGLSQWWTKDTQGNTDVGSTIQFRFNGEGPDMEVIKSTSDSVIWKCLSGHDEWLNTEIHFAVKQENETTIYFQHKNWPNSESSMFHHCSMKWAVFMLSLKSYLDGEEGRPFPNDIKVSTLGY